MSSCFYVHVFVVIEEYGDGNDDDDDDDDDNDKEEKKRGRLQGNLSIS